jgi:hypothetical protein
MAETKAAHPPAETSSAQRLSRVGLSKFSSPALSSCFVIQQEDEKKMNKRLALDIPIWVFCVIS